MRLIKFVKLTGLSYACNSLTWHPLEYEGHAMTGIGNEVNFLILAFKIREITSRTYFWWV